MRTEVRQLRLVERLLLFSWAGLSYSEISEALGVRLGTVQSRINRARNRLLEELGGINPMAIVGEETLWE
ncbi:sigma factor-like helix-turn-helix DNA-binding protein [Nonomuraea sp. NPDC050691]|uniref:sigma factor-like helix-turn-helix DNA-binding protein n=1 Tax=Nonomuraea sp. NPDC050691 TaxID=3155661 RepID=UPI00340CD4F6